MSACMGLILIILVSLVLRMGPGSDSQVGDSGFYVRTLSVAARARPDSRVCNGDGKHHKETDISERFSHRYVKPTGSLNSDTSFQPHDRS